MVGSSGGLSPTLGEAPICTGKAVVLADGRNQEEEKDMDVDGEVLMVGTRKEYGVEDVKENAKEVGMQSLVDVEDSGRGVEEAKAGEGSLVHFVTCSVIRVT